MTEEVVIKESGSLKGWEFKKWFTGNWKTIKELLKVGIPAVIGWVITRNEVAAGFITIVGKFIMDVGEYFFKQYTE